MPVRAAVSAAAGAGQRSQLLQGPGACSNKRGLPRHALRVDSEAAPGADDVSLRQMRPSSICKCGWVVEKLGGQWDSWVGCGWHIDMGGVAQAWRAWV